jgi:hypothetical protein
MIDMMKKNKQRQEPEPAATTGRMGSSLRSRAPVRFANPRVRGHWEGDYPPQAVKGAMPPQECRSPSRQRRRDRRGLSPRG